MGSEQNVLSGNKVGSHVESIGMCSLVLDNDYVLDLKGPFLYQILLEILFQFQGLYLHSPMKRLYLF